MDDIPFHTAHWLNTDRPLTLEDFCGRALAVEVFQMLCPGCVLNGLPQAQRLAQTFDEKDLTVIDRNHRPEDQQIGAAPPVGRV